MTLTSKALWILERNLNAPYDLAKLAEACGVSSFHLAHAFARATGQSVMAYLRARRLSIAATALASGAPDILHLALSSGYASHEAFSRAFKQQFGQTPDSVRRLKSTQGLAMVHARAFDDGETHLTPPRIVQGDELRIVGLSERQPFGEAHDIPGQWQRFMAIYPQIAHKQQGKPIGVGGELTEDGHFHYICAAEVTRFSDAPAPLVEMTIPQHLYAVFRHDGHVAQMGATYRAIWNYDFPSRGLAVVPAYCIERHLPSFNPATGDGGVEIWIPVAETPEKAK
jgi:AraC family transcriptional regulator